MFFLKTWVTIFHIVSFTVNKLSATKVRIMTWNVDLNKRMENRFTDEAIDRVLGIDQGFKNSPLIYAIALQDNCWNCDKENIPWIGDRFLARINAVAEVPHEVINVQATRWDNDCEEDCQIGAAGLGTSILIIIARPSLITSNFVFRHHKGCHECWKKNKQIGIVAISMKLKVGKTLCFGAVRLHDYLSEYKRQCLKGFFEETKNLQNWKDCNSLYLFGDFNTKTQNDTDSKLIKGYYLPRSISFDMLMEHDELTGCKPFGKNDLWKKSLLQFVNQVQPKTFVENPVEFMPTYHIVSADKYCRGRFPCYHMQHARSWTDRVIHFQGGNCLSYNATYGEYGSHFPVFAEFKLK